MTGPGGVPYEQKALERDLLKIGPEIVAALDGPRLLKAGEAKWIHEQLRGLRIGLELMCQASKPDDELDAVDALIGTLGAQWDAESERARARR